MDESLLQIHLVFIIVVMKELLPGALELQGNPYRRRIDELEAENQKVDTITQKAAALCDLVTTAFSLYEERCLTKSTRVSIIKESTYVSKNGNQQHKERKEKIMGSKKETTRENILEISYALFAKNGFNSITMKDVCEATQLSRGGLYSHFGSTADIFEAILLKINQKKEMNFSEEMEKGISAITILDQALALMEDEMNHPEDSLSLAMYEYTGNVESKLMDDFNQIGEEKWTSLIQYGMARAEFKPVEVKEIVNVILYVYQGVRMWSRIVKMDEETMQSITSHIRKQLVMEVQ